MKDSIHAIYFYANGRPTLTLNFCPKRFEHKNEIIPQNIMSIWFGKDLFEDSLMFFAHIIMVL